MSNQTHSDQAVIQYLLGSLPEAETEHFDELSLTEQFADKLAEVEKDLVDAYVQGELMEPELAQFKSHYLASRRGQAQVGFARAFQVFAAKNTGSETADRYEENPAKAVTKPKSSGWFTKSRVANALRPAWAGWHWWQLGMAVAVLALVVAGSWLAFERVGLRRQVAGTQERGEPPAETERELQNRLAQQPAASATIEEEQASVSQQRQRLEQERTTQREKERSAEQRLAAKQPQQPSPGKNTIASFVLTPQLRGTGQIPAISLPAHTTQVAMRLALEPNEHTAYRVALLDRAGSEILWHSGQLKANLLGNDKTLNVSIRAGLLKPQKAYLLRVTAGGDEIIGDYPFLIVK